MRRLSSRTIVLSALLLFAFQSDAHAYIDGGTASMLFQLLIAGALGGLFTIKAFWAQIKQFLGSLIRRKTDVGE